MILPSLEPLKTVREGMVENLLAGDELVSLANDMTFDWFSWNLSRNSDELEVVVRAEVREVKSKSRTLN